MNRAQLVREIELKKSYLCVGLDTVVNKMPVKYPRNPEGMLAFNKMVIEETSDLCVAYKPNTAFYEAWGSEGWDVLKQTIAAIPKECFVIADAKRGDIGNTASAYAKALFLDLGADAVTVSPYMGKDAVEPFLNEEGKWTIVLGVTSNPGAADFQYHGTPPLYELVTKTCLTWGSPDQLMFVVGATRPDEMRHFRDLAPENFYLVPGVGAQGGDLKVISEAGFIRTGSRRGVGLLVNSSRGIIYAGDGANHRERIRAAARQMQQEMADLLDTLHDD